jgi:hypothetical protein
MPFVPEDKTIAVSGASACQSLTCPSQSATNFRPFGCESSNGIYSPNYSTNLHGYPN